MLAPIMSKLVAVWPILTLGIEAIELYFVDRGDFRYLTQKIIAK